MLVNCYLSELVTHDAKHIKFYRENMLFRTPTLVLNSFSWASSSSNVVTPRLSGPVGNDERGIGTLGSSRARFSKHAPREILPVQAQKCVPFTPRFLSLELLSFSSYLKTKNFT